jgi:hypothetical protein
MSSHGHIDPSNKKIALLIAILALILAFSETLAKGSQTNALSHNIEASNLWSFFQAKTIRMTTVRTAMDAAEMELKQTRSEAGKEILGKQIESWKKAAARYDSEPETREGRKELMTRARSAEKERDRAMAAYHHYELASAALQIAIVLASAQIITGVAALAWISGGLGVVGLAFSFIGYFAPLAIHLF